MTSLPTTISGTCTKCGGQLPSPHAALCCSCVYEELYGRVQQSVFKSYPGCELLYEIRERDSQYSVIRRDGHRDGVRVGCTFSSLKAAVDYAERYFRPCMESGMKPVSDEMKNRLINAQKHVVQLNELIAQLRQDILGGKFVGELRLGCTGHCDVSSRGFSGLPTPVKKRLLSACLTVLENEIDRVNSLWEKVKMEE